MIGSELHGQVPGVQNLVGTRGFPSFPKNPDGLWGAHLGIKQPECEAVGTYPFGAYIMDVFKLCVLEPYTLWWCLTFRRLTSTIVDVPHC